DEHAVRRRGVEEADHAGEPRPRTLVDQADALGARRLELAGDVTGRKAQVVQPLAALRQEPADAARRLEGLEELDLALADREQRRPDALIDDGRDLVDGQPEDVAPEAVGLVEAPDDDANVVNPGER